MMHQGAGKKRELITPPRQPRACAWSYTGAQDSYQQPQASPGSWAGHLSPLQRTWGVPELGVTAVGSRLLGGLHQR